MTIHYNDESKVEPAEHNRLNVWFEEKACFSLLGAFACYLYG